MKILTVTFARSQGMAYLTDQVTDEVAEMVATQFQMGASTISYGVGQNQVQINPAHVAYILTGPAEEEA